MLPGQGRVAWRGGLWPGEGACGVTTGPEKLRIGAERGERTEGLNAEELWGSGARS